MKAILLHPKRIFKAIFDTLIFERATKQKLFPVGYDSGSILTKKNRKKFVNEKLEKSTRIALQNHIFPEFSRIFLVIRAIYVCYNEK